MQQLSLIMFSCKHELASIVTHSCNLMGKAKTMTNLYPSSLGHISANEGALPVKLRLQLADACPPLWCKKKIFVTATLIPPTTHKTVLQYMVTCYTSEISCDSHFDQHMHALISPSSSMTLSTLSFLCLSHVRWQSKCS